eukprot:TRINITY_DN60895_c0_g1_i1.p1 TRINITY_DN60895_c0_g1~~TRINITY_DN60895_c0_g1_i1.p1  ORF type:complete len:876 (+),score=254.74 TRINITY_DN60895_c0_g1_i1:80-2629(+)
MALVPGEEALAARVAERTRPPTPEPWQLPLAELGARFGTELNAIDPARSAGLDDAVAEQRLEQQGPNRVMDAEPSDDPGLDCSEMVLAALSAEHSSETIGSDADSGFLSMLPRGLLERLCLRLMDSVDRSGTDWVSLMPDRWQEAVAHWRRQRRLALSREAAREQGTVAVIRRGEARELGAERIVPGDLVRLAAGQTSPADCVVIDIPPESGPVVLSLAALCGVRSTEPRAVYRAPDALVGARNLIPAGSLLLSGSVLAVVGATGQRSAVGALVSGARAVPRALPPAGMEHLPGDANAAVSHVPGVSLNSRLCGALLPRVDALVIEKEMLAPLLQPLRVTRVTCAGYTFAVSRVPGRLPYADALACDEEGDEILRLCTGTHPPRLFLGAAAAGGASLSARAAPLLRSELLRRPLLAACLASTAVGRNASAAPGSVDPAVQAAADWAAVQPELQSAAAEYSTPRGAHRFFPQLRLHASLHVCHASDPPTALLLLYGAAADVLQVSPICLRAGGCVQLSSAARYDVERQLSPEALRSPEGRIIGFAAAEVGDHLIPSQTRSVWDTIEDVQAFVSRLSSACFLGALVVDADEAAPAAGAALRRIAEHGIAVHVVSAAAAPAVSNVARSPALEGLACEVRECAEGRGGVLLDAACAAAPCVAGSPGAVFHAGIRWEGTLRLVEALRNAGNVPCVCVSSLAALAAARAANLSVAAVPRDGWWDPPEDRTGRTTRVLVDGGDAAAHVRSLCHMETEPDGLPLLGELLCAGRLPRLGQQAQGATPAAPAEPPAAAPAPAEAPAPAAAPGGGGGRRRSSGAAALPPTPPRPAAQSDGQGPPAGEHMCGSAATGIRRA